MRIGELARQSGVSTQTIRYYEDIGVMPRPPRAENGYRDYGPEAIDRLTFVRDAQDGGLTLEEIASVLELRGHGEATCEHVIGLLERHLEEVDRRIASLRESRDLYASLIGRARDMEPGDCTDPNRCQTISNGPARRSAGSQPRSERWHRGAGHAELVTPVRRRVRPDRGR